jgi:Tol biopolymer transport system component
MARCGARVSVTIRKNDGAVQLSFAKAKDSLRGLAQLRTFMKDLKMSPSQTKLSLLLSFLALTACGPSVGGNPDITIQEIRFDKVSDHGRFSPGDGNRTAFVQSTRRVSDTDTSGKETFNVMVMNNLGTGRTPIALSGSRLVGPAWAPDGNTVYFASDEGISSVPAEGGVAPTVVVNDHSTVDPDISWDGKRLVYSGSDSYLKLVDLSNPTLVVDLNQKGVSPRFSPDGKTIAFADDQKIKTIDPVTFKVKVLVNAGTYLASVDWFPDGKRMAMTSDAGVEIITLGPPADHDLVKEQFGAQNLDVSTDGRYIIYNVNGDTSMYVISDF